MFYFLHLTVGPTREVCVSLPDPCPPLVIHWRQQDEGKDRIWRFHPWYHHHPSTASTDYTYHRLWGEFSSMMTFNYWCKLINWFGNMQFLIYNYWILVIKNSLFMPPLRSSRRHYVFGLSVRTYVRLYVRTSRSCDHVIWRTDWSIPAKLWSCMYLAEPMNWLDFGVTRSKVKGHRAH